MSLRRSRGGLHIYLWRYVFSWTVEDGFGASRWRGIIRLGFLCTLRRHR